MEPEVCVTALHGGAEAELTLPAVLQPRSLAMQQPHALGSAWVPSQHDAAAGPVPQSCLQQGSAPCQGMQRVPGRLQQPAEV